MTVLPDFKKGYDSFYEEKGICVAVGTNINNANYSSGTRIP